jgi:TatD DNase family protein
VFDSHCHLDQPLFDADRAAVLTRARTAGVTAILVPAIRPRTWSGLLALPAAHPEMQIVLALGVHPQSVPALDPAERALARDADALAAAIAGRGAVAVGECGLDGATSEPEEQELILRAHVRAARLLRLPLVVHVLRAHGAAPRILAEEGAAEVGGVLHSYSGGAALVPVYARLGFVFSFSGAVTWRNARRPVEAARAIPAERLLAETDAPDQSPEPHRGGRCEPAHLSEVVRGLAAARGGDAEAMGALTDGNARRVFRL